MDSCESFLYLPFLAELPLRVFVLELASVHTLSDMFVWYLLVCSIVSLALFLQFFSIITREQPATLRRSKLA